MKKIIPSLIIIFSLFGCRNNQNLMYLKNIESYGYDQVYEKSAQLYTIQPHDILYIRILSSNREIADLYNNLPTKGISTTMSSEADQYVNGFSVNKDGAIHLPVLGPLKVIDLNLQEIYELIQAKANEYLIDATVIVRLLNYKVTVLGEVKRPGVYFNYNDQLTVMEAIGRAADVTEFGNKENVLVIRPTKEGTTTFELDLTDINVLTKQGYYLMPNDIVYIKPAKNKAFRINLPGWHLLLSSVTTLIVLLQYFDK
ncbi:sugar transporter [Marinilabiliaceae bacterium JC017]|nr:sugar transporter [Marinilabiliaceae bacterium JC017]